MCFISNLLTLFLYEELVNLNLFLFNFESCDILFEVTRKSSCFCKVACGSKVIGPCCSITTNISVTNKETCLVWFSCCIVAVIYRFVLSYYFVCSAVFAKDLSSLRI